ncbi:branched-chain amino acid ABC transporter, ATP-binding protein [Variovorax paradoxus B4]|uniref:Branched-chain amino acid ABC transporter, ATP-binding protein n=1 Tax=Variovorax paradoxus B4 TaxID=1246301 RepID=T1XMF5_VARPD|nr:ABC transporter ATP-binding protein [Variovorax paradoxus]AGU53783.1 branched-chain amino acid ABC transporter, ATP-binding protein [Variovorax paradoxus B4]
MSSATTGSSAALEVRGLFAGYGRIEALHGIDLRLGRGELVALIGANGAGKTTLLRALSGLIKPSAGSVSLFGREIGRESADARVRAGLSQVLEGRQVFGPLSVQDNLLLGSYTRPERRQQRMEEMYALFPILQEKRLLAAGTLSGGQQQMLAIARALMSEPKVLLLDEPSMGLAPLLVKEIFGVIARLKAQGIPILLVEQNAHAALSVADVGYVLETGTITLGGPAAQLLRDERVKAAYLGL